MKQKTRENIREWLITLTIGLRFALICLLWAISSQNKRDVEYETIAVKYFVYCTENSIFEPNHSTWLAFREKE